MATEGSTAAAATSSGRSASGGAKADSYIGSVISLTSKSEIRYEGILYNINTEESSIGLQNVRSFGTEGRKKDGPQVPPSDKIYEYILFRGSDIKDLQVKASPPVQSAPPINSDPAIIQSHYPPPTAQRPSLPTAPGVSLADHVSNSSQMGLPLYQPGGNFNSWAPHPNANASGMAVPMYWPGFYGTPGGVPQLPQQSLLVPPPGLSIPSAMQSMQFSGFSSSLPTALPSLPTSSTQDHHSLVAPNTTGSSTLTSNSLPPSTLPFSIPLQTGPLPSESSNSIIQNKVPTPAIAASAPSSSLPQLSQIPALVSDHSVVHPVAIKTVAAPGPVALTTQTTTLPPRNATVSVAPGSSVLDTSAPSLVNPGKVPQPPPSASAPQSSQTAQKDVEVVQVSPKQQSEPLLSSEAEAQPPLLPLPPSIRTQKVNGTSQTIRTNYRGRGGRVSAASGPSTSFTEEFDFNAMNEKFNKDEVWGHLGKVSKPEYGNFHEEDALEEEYGQLPKIEIKPVYNKDDFFDTLSCNTAENDFNNGRPRYSEQMKLNTETFGDFPGHRGGRGGRAPYRGGGGFRGSHSGRGYGGGRSRGNMTRGRGRGVPAWAS